MKLSDIEAYYLNFVAEQGTTIDRLISAIHYDRAALPSYEVIEKFIIKCLSYKIITTKKTLVFKETVYFLDSVIREELNKTENEYKGFSEDPSDYYEGQEACEKYLMSIEFNDLIKEESEHQLDRKAYNIAINKIDKAFEEHIKN